MINQRIIIVGFMAAGKTTVAHRLARELDDRVVDLDAFILERDGRGPQQVIEQDGEAAFRKAETAALHEVLSDAGARVIALGGGAWTVKENREMIAQHGVLTVWLDAPFELCWKRIEADQGARPLAPSGEQALKLYAERRPVYAFADARISVSEDESAEMIVLKITNLAFGGAKT